MPGCTDTSACNYDAAATSDNGSCESLSCSGCTYADATNYDSTATIDDGSCVFPDITSDNQEAYDEGVASVCPGDFSGDGNVNVSDLGGFLGAFGSECSTSALLGCTDSTAFNYDSNANTDDGSCIAVVNGCTDPTATNYNASANTDDGSCLMPFTGAIGDTYQGGIVFWLDGSGGGLIAAPTDHSNTTTWGCQGTLISGADENIIGTGAQNTIDIEAGCGTPGTAADICTNLVLSGYTDWFLPSKNELNLMYQNIGQGNALGLGNAGDFNIYGYWSSTERDMGSAFIQIFDNGFQGFVSKNSNNYVRAVRAF